MMTGIDNREWGPWIDHDDAGWPKGVEPDEVVIAQLMDTTLSPMVALNITWHCPGDPVIRYRRRIEPSAKQASAPGAQEGCNS